MRRALLIVLVAVALPCGAAGCGGGEAPEEVLRGTVTNLGDIRTGTLDLSFLVTPRGKGEPFGFELRGPFSLRGSGPLPVFRIEYTQIANGERGSVTLISTGRKAYISLGGETYRLTDEQAEDLRGVTGTLDGKGELRELRLDDWIVEADVSDGGEVNGVATDRVRGRLDVVAAVGGLLALARGLGRDVAPLDREGARQLRRATRAAVFELHTGKDDRLLRRLTITADFGLDVPASLRRALGASVGAQVAFRLGVAKPNAPVTVTEPRDAQPALALSTD